MTADLDAALDQAVPTIDDPTHPDPWPRGKTAPQSVALPWFPERAQDVLNDPRIASLSPAELGVLCKLRWSYWVANRLPSDSYSLAKMLAFARRELRYALTNRVLAFFEPAPDDATRLICPDLDRLRTQQLAKRAQQVEGGRIGAAKRWPRDRLPNGLPTPKPTAKDGLPIGEPIANPMLRASTSAFKKESTYPRSSTPADGKASVDSWTQEYEEAEKVACSPEAYRRASRGG